MKRKNFFNIFAAFAMIFTSAKAVDNSKQGLQKTQPVQKIKTVEMPAQDRVDYMTTGYTKQEIDSKLEKLYQNIQGTQKEIDNIKRIFQKMAQYGIGQRTIMQMPENIKIYDSKGKLMDTDTVALYRGGNKTILLSTDTDTQKTTIRLAHEGRHAIQDADGRLDYESPFLSERFVQRKICEMETKLQDTVFESQIKQGKNVIKTSTCLFYEAELKRYKGMGLSQEEAERAARTSIVQVYWSGLYEKPDGCSEISEGLRGEIRYWNNAYDKQDFFIVANFENFKDGLDIEKAEQIEQEQAEAEKNGSINKLENRNHTLLLGFVKEMDINLPETWFTSIQRTRSTVGDNLIVTYYPSGTKEKEIFVCGDSLVTIREHSEPDTEHPEGVVLHEVTYNSLFTRKEGLEIYRYPNGNLKCETPYNYGVIDGVEKMYAEDGKTVVSEIEYKNGKVAGEREVLYDKNGKEITQKDIYENAGLKEYVRKKYARDGETLVLEAWYKNGQISILKHYDEHSKRLLEEISYKDGKIDVKKFYFESGGWIETPYKDYVIDGVEKEYASDGKTILRETPYENDVKNGIEKRYASDGKTVMYETPYKNDVIDGIKKVRFENGSGLDIPYKNGVVDGVEKEYACDGKTVVRETLYKDGKEVPNKLIQLKGIQNIDTH